MTDGEFVVVFDADHVADRQFIERLIGYFADESMGFVQTPHAFYNFDAFQGVLNYERRKYWEEGMLFYNVIQPGKNRWNAVSFCGSAAMLRRKALEDVGLVATESITEDMLTGLRMHAKGWKSLFVNERLIAALAAEDIASFTTQRLRWGEGNLGIFAIENPLTMRGLTWPQRICYAGSILSWTTGVKNLLIYSTPMLMLLTGMAPVNKLTWQFALLVSVYLAAVWTGVKIAGNGYGWLLAIEMTQMVSFWTQVRSTWRAVFNRKRAKFVVTSKRRTPSNSVLRHVAPHVVYMAGSALAILWALTRFLLHPSHDVVGLTIGSALLLIYSSMAWIVVRRALHTKDRRSSWRHPVALHVNYEAVGDDGVRICGQGVTRDINEAGMGLVTFERLPDKGQVLLTTTVADRTVACRGTVRSQQRVARSRVSGGTEAEAFMCGIEFVNPENDQLDTLWWMGSQFAVCLTYEHFSGGRRGIDPVDSRELTTRSDEKKFELPVTLKLTDGRLVAAVTETIGSDTMTVLMSADVSKAKPVRLDFTKPFRGVADAISTAGPIRLDLATPFGRVDAWAELIDSRTSKVAGCAMQSARIRFCEMPAESRVVLESTLRQSGSKELAPVLNSMPMRRPPESLRPAGIVIGTTGIAAALVIAYVLSFNIDEFTITRAEGGYFVTQGLHDRLSEMAQHVRLETAADEEQVSRLRAAIVKLNQESDLQRIDEAIANTNPKGIEGQIIKAASLQNLKREPEAEAIYQQVLAQLEGFDDDRKWETILSAAHNAASMGEFSEAASRYKQLERYGPLTDAVRMELAGVLLQTGQASEAEKLLKQGSPTFDNLRLLASICSSTQQFSQAVKVYEKMLAMRPDNWDALLGKADNLSWLHEYDRAASIYRKLLERNDGDEDVQKRLAEALLYGERHQESLREYASLLSHARQRQDLWNGFLMAAAGSPKLSKSDQTLLHELYEQRDRKQDTEFLRSLASAEAKHGKLADAVALMEPLVEREPRDSDLRLQLADALHKLKRYQEADVQYQRLLGDMETPSVLTSDTTPPEVPSE